MTNVGLDNGKNCQGSPLCTQRDDVKKKGDWKVRGED